MALLESEQNGVDGEVKDDYFKQILKEEFSDRSTEMDLNHKMIVDNFNVECKLQLNKDIKSPIMPATLKFPQLYASIKIGKSESGSENGDSDQILTFSAYQPQLLRVVKTLEIIGIFNEFNHGALFNFSIRRLEDVQIQKYMELYQEWNGVESSTVPAEKQRAEGLREEMLEIEKLVTAELIIEIRQVSCQRIQSEQSKQKEIEELEERIKKLIKEKTGWFTPAAER